MTVTTAEAALTEVTAGLFSYSDADEFIEAAERERAEFDEVKLATPGTTRPPPITTAGR